ncbi:MAG: Bro-N domain-containing protein [Ignavibacteriales bacterium]
MKNSEKAIKLFNEKQIRTHWDDNEEQWYFSIVDVVLVLTNSIDANAYWRKLKERLKNEGNETVTNCHTLKMPAIDGKMRITDVANTEQLLRLIQSIPSKNAEPFKLWLAKVGNERIDEIYDPEKAIVRALDFYRKKGYSEDWINQRLKTIDARKELTDEWKQGGITKGSEYAILTDEMTKAWTGMTTREYKNLKGLKKESLRDNMTNLELVLNMLAEVSSTEISREKNPFGFDENKEVAVEGGTVAKVAKEEVEKRTGKKAVTSQNAKTGKVILNK